MCEEALHTRRFEHFLRQLLDFLVVIFIISANWLWFSLSSTKKGFNHQLIGMAKRCSVLGSKVPSTIPQQHWYKISRKEHNLTLWGRHSLCPILTSSTSSWRKNERQNLFAFCLSHMWAHSHATKVVFKVCMGHFGRGEGGLEAAWGRARQDGKEVARSFRPVSS